MATIPLRYYQTKAEKKESNLKLSFDGMCQNEAPKLFSSRPVVFLKETWS
jgi:hypothetical protein